jgi:hypothetical protein
MINLFIYNSLSIYLIDKVFIYLKIKALSRWYILHSISNAIICYTTFTPMITFLSNPIYHIQNPIQFDDSIITIAIIHSYHLLFFNCTKSDYIHHILFVFLGTITHFLVNLGYIIPLYHFFISGLPGGIDYAALALVQENKITKTQRVKLAVELNNWIRAPGVISAWIFGYIYFITYEKTLTNIICFTIMTNASVLNAIYYSRQVTLYAGKFLT